MDTCNKTKQKKQTNERIAYSNTSKVRSLTGISLLLKVHFEPGSVNANFSIRTSTQFAGDFGSEKSPTQSKLFQEVDLRVRQEHKQKFTSVHVTCTGLELNTTTRK